MRRLFPKLPILAFAVLVLSALGFSAAQAADRARLEAFLNVTGFDVALDSIRLSADSAPQMLGLEAADFGSEWSRLVNEVFDSEIMHGLALDILSETLSDAGLIHAADFYASPLGQRLVAAENAAHMVEDDAEKERIGREILDGSAAIGSPRSDLLTRLNDAIGSEETSVQAIQEVQVRFLLAAAGAGVIELQMEEPDLRGALAENDEELRAAIRTGALTNSAYTYQAFSDLEVTRYAEALEAPLMREVYALMNAVQFEVMANRFEVVAQRLGGMQPSQEL